MNTQTHSNDPALMTWALRMAVYPLFLISGAAGLMCEVAWTRMLLAIFGAGIYAVAAVLAAFMAGLALGSWLLGRVTDRMQRPLRVYGILEFLIGGMGLLIPLLIQLIDKVDGWAYLNFEQNFTVLTALRFGVAFTLMLIPTTLMGATLPVLSRFMIRDQERMGLHVGSLYAINTLGAVTGAFLAGFVLIGAFGLFATQCIAAACNFIVGIAAIAFSLKTERGGVMIAEPAAEMEIARADEAPAGPLWQARWVLMTAFITGIVALAAQVMWSRSLIFAFEYLKNTTYSFSAMLTVFLAGLAVGSAFIGPFVDRHANPYRLYGTLLALIGTTIIISVWVLEGGASGFKLADPQNPDTSLNWVRAVFNIMLQTFGVLGLPTLLMGMAFPVAARVVVRFGNVGRDVGRLYALNTVGAILGSVLAGFVLAPLLGLTNSLLLLGAVDLILGITTLALMWRESGRYLLLVAAPTVIVSLAVVLMLPHDNRLQPLEYSDRALHFYREGPLATVAVVENNVEESTIYVDGVGVAGTDPILQTDQKSLAHVAMGLVPESKAALTVGFGSGGASYSLLLHDRLEKVHCVEICTTVLEAAPHLRAANHHFFAAPVAPAELQPGMMLAQPWGEKDGGPLYAASTYLSKGMIATIQGDAPNQPVLVGNPLSFSQTDPRYQIILDDARSYLRHTTERYDFIATDCTDLRYKSNANLYDLEYFQACKDRLTEQGIVVVWMPLGGLSPEVFKIALRTFARVFPEMGIFFMTNEPTHYILLIGWQGKAQLDYAAFQQMLSEDDVRTDLAELYLDDPVKLLSCYIAGGKGLADYLAGDALNTENYPLIEFESPKYGYGDKPVNDNVRDLMALGSSPLDILNTATIPPAELDRLKRFAEATPAIIEGHCAYRDLRLDEATRNYMKAADLAPEDLSLTRNLLTFPMLQRRIELEPNNPHVYRMLGQVRMIEGRMEEAYDLLERADELFARGNRKEDKPFHDQVKEWRAAVRASIEEQRGF